MSATGAPPAEAPDPATRIALLETRLAEALRFLGHDAREGHSSTLALLELQRIKAEPMSLAQFAERVEANARKSLAAIDDFADLARARGQALQLAQIDLLDLLVEVVADAWPAASQRGVRIQLGEHPEEIMGLADAELLRNALAKLVRDLVARARPGNDIVCTLNPAASGPVFEFSVGGPGSEEPAPGEVRRPMRLSPGLLLAQAVAERHGGGLRSAGPGLQHVVISLSLSVQVTS